MEEATHIVVFPFPAQGHINPGLQFSQQLASLHLCKVTFVNTSYQISKLREAALDLGPSVRLQALADGGEHGEGPDFCNALDKMGAKLLEELLSKLQRSECTDAGEEDLAGKRSPWPSPVCIISDVFLSWVQDVADKHKLPRFILFTPPAATLVLMLSLPDMLQQHRLPLCNTGDADHARRQPLNLPGLTQTLCLSDIPSHLLLPPSAFMFNYFICHSKRIPEAAAVLVNTFHELESTAIDAARQLLGPFPAPRADWLKEHLPHRVLPVGPLLPSHTLEEDLKIVMAARAKGPEDELCLQWLEKQPRSSVVYVSFGSMAELPEKQICALAEGLEASGKPYILVVRGWNVSQCLGAIAAGTESSRGLVVSWAPQVAILGHPSTAFFLSHCGWNSTLEAICMGVPLLCWPIFAEQKMNCRFLVDELKVAMEFGRDEAGFVSKEEAERVIKEALETEHGHALNRRAAMWNGLARKAASEGSHSQDNVKVLVSSLSSLAKLASTCA